MDGRTNNKGTKGNKGGRPSKAEEVKMIVEEMGASNFDREIIHLCDKKGEMSYLEAKEQLK